MCQLSSSRANLGKRELSCQGDNLPPVPLRDPFWSSQREQPLGPRELPQVQLWAAKRCVNAAGIRHLGDLLMIGLEGEGIQGECRRLVFDFERFFVDPHRDLFPGKPIFAKEPPVAEANVLMLVQMTGKLRGIEHPREDLFRVRSSQHPALHIGGAVPPVLAGAMGKVMLAVVMVPPLLVFREHLRPSARIGKAVVGKPSLY